MEGFTLLLHLVLVLLDESLEGEQTSHDRLGVVRLLQVKRDLSTQVGPLVRMVEAGNISDTGHILLDDLLLLTLVHRFENIVAHHLLILIRDDYPLEPFDAYFIRLLLSLVPPVAFSHELQLDRSRLGDVGGFGVSCS